MAKDKELKVVLTKEFESGDKVVYTNYGRFKKSSKGKVTLIVGEGDDQKKIKANHA